MWNRFYQSFLNGVLAIALAVVANVSIAAETGGHNKVVDGVAIYLGVMPAEIVQEHPEAHPERQMHRGTPSSKAYRHVVVALFDSTNGKRITDAQVTAKVAEISLAGSEKKLEPMNIADTITYGNYFPMSGAGPYRITVQIRRPGKTQPIKAVFEYRHQRD